MVLIIVTHEVCHQTLQETNGTLKSTIVLAYEWGKWPEASQTRLDCETEVKGRVKDAFLRHGCTTLIWADVGEEEAAKGHWIDPESVYV